MGEFSLGFLEENTPSRGIQEFYRTQGFKQGYEQGSRDRFVRAIAVLEEHARKLKAYNPISGEERAQMIYDAIDLLKGETD